MVFLDPIATATTERVGFLIIVFIIVASITSVALAVVSFANRNEKKGIAIISLLLIIINISIIIFFMWFGSNFV